MSGDLVDEVPVGDIAEVEAEEFGRGGGADLWEEDNGVSDGEEDALALASSAGPTQTLPADVESLKQRLVWWYSVQPSLRVDFIEAFGGHILIHAESLILNLTRRNDLYEDGMLHEDSPQTLRVVYFAERFLTQLKQCGAHYTIVFFNSFRNVYDNLSPTLWATRNLLLLHFQTCVSDASFRVFEDPWHPQYAEFLREERPSCMVLEDGSAKWTTLPSSVDVAKATAGVAGKEDFETGGTTVSASSTDKNVDEEGDEEDAESELALTVPLAFMMTCLSQAMGVALLDGITRDGRKVFSRAMLPDSSYGWLFNRSYDEIYALLKATPSDEDSAAPDSLTIDAVGDGFLQSADQSESSVKWQPGLRAAAATIFVRQNRGETAFDDKEEEINFHRLELFGKCLLLKDILLQNIALQDRCHSSCQPNGTFFSDWLRLLSEYFLSALSPSIEKLTSELLASSQNAVPEGATASPSASPSACEQFLRVVNKREAADFFDFRLLKTLFVLLAAEAQKSDTKEISAEFFALPDEIAQSLSKFWKARSGTKSDASFFPLNVELLLEDLDENLQLPSASDERIAELLPIQCPLVNKVLKTSDAREAIPCAKITKDANERHEEFLSELKQDYFHLYDKMHDTGKSKYEKRIAFLAQKAYYKKRTAGMNAVQLANFKDRMIGKWRNQEIRDMKSISRSLVGTDALHHPVVLRPFGHPWSVETPAAGAVAAAGAKKTEAEANAAAPVSGKQKAVKTSAGGSKAQAIIEKNKEAQLKKVLTREQENTKGLNKKLDILKKKTDPAEFNEALLDTTAGKNRKMDSFGDFGGIANVLQLPESQCKFFVSVIEVCTFRQQAFKTVTFTTSSPATIKHARRTLILIFRLVHDVYNSYEACVDAAAIEAMQKAQITCGFFDSARRLFDSWVAFKLNEFDEKPIEAAGPAAGGGGGGGKKGGGPAKKGGGGGGGKVGGGKKAQEKAMEEQKKKGREELQNELSKSKVADCPVSEFRVPRSLESEFQLRFMGAEMERTTGTKEDEKNRVKFKPDAWQRRLLDVVDSQESALVVAPTAAGKTFICYYAMDLVLRKDDESVVVFVAPTKALVNQVKLEVHTRFSSKTYKSGAPGTLQGDAQPETCADITDCQILVTLPEILESLLLSTEPVYRKWISRLRYVIFDEVHCIGSGKASRQLEHLVQMIPSPFLALSATVGNPLSFHKWLARAQLPNKERGSTVHIITHGERYSDLSLYVYSADRDEVLALNSVSCFQFRQWKDHVMPIDFYLTTEETLQLHSATSAILAKKMDSKTPLIKSSEGGASYTFQDAKGGNVQFSEKCFNNARQLIIRSPDTLASSTVLSEEAAASVLREAVMKMSPEAAASFVANCDAAPESVVRLFIDDLSPNAYLKSRCIRKRQYRYYLASVLKSFQMMIDCGVIDEDLYEQILSELQILAHESDEVRWCQWMLHNDGTVAVQSRNEKVLQVVRQPSLAASQDVASTVGDATTAAPSESTLTMASNSTRKRPVRVTQSFRDPARMLKVIRGFSAKKLLPMIVFNFATDSLDSMAKALFDKFSKEQWDKYYGDEDKAYRTRMINKTRMDAYRQMLKTREMSMKLRGMGRVQREEQGLADDMDVDLLEDVPPPPKDIAEEIDQEFSLANRDALGLHGEWITDQFEKLEALRDKMKDKKKLGDWHVDGLKRGIGVHHERLNPVYRSAVEVLFRMGYLSVVFASGTLALGINMPCRTTLFAGDSLELTPLMFRQMSGRAGRRGHDNKGHVVFWDILPDKVDRLLSAQLPVLSGSFPGSPALVLRTENLYNTLTEPDRRDEKTKLAIAVDPKDVSIAGDGISQFFANPLFSIKDRDAEPTEAEKETMFHLATVNYRFTVDFLRRGGWLDSNGKCESFHQTILHTFEEEPGCILLADLIRRGYLQEIAVKHEKTLLKEAWNDPDKIIKMRINQADELLPVLAKVLARRPLTPAVAIAAMDQRVRETAQNVELSMPRFSQYTPAIPPLPQNITAAIDEFNQLALSVYADCQTAFGSARPVTQADTRLPLSALDFDGCCSVARSAPSPTSRKENIPPSSSKRLIGSDKSPLASVPFFQKYSETVLNARSRSPFSALAGLADGKVISGPELCLSIRADSYLEANMLPTVEARKTSGNYLARKSQSEVQLESTELELSNSFILEFWRHGKFALLSKNGVFGADQYFFVNSFLKALQSFTRILKTCYREFSPMLEQLLFREGRYLVADGDGQAFVDDAIREEGLTAEDVQNILGPPQDSHGTSRNLKPFIESLHFAGSSGDFHSLLPVVDAFEFIIHRMEAQFRAQRA